MNNSSVLNAFQKEVEKLLYKNHKEIIKIKFQFIPNMNRYCNSRDILNISFLIQTDQYIMNKLTNTGYDDILKLINKFFINYGLQHHNILLNIKFYPKK